MVLRSCIPALHLHEREGQVPEHECPQLGLHPVESRGGLQGDRVGAAKLGKYDCWVLDLEATSDDITFPKMKIWISDDGLVRKTEDYSYSGQHLRTVAFPQYQQIGTRFIPQLVVILDELRGAMIDGKFVQEKTTYTISRPSLQRLPDATFTKIWLEKLSE